MCSLFRPTWENPPSSKPKQTSATAGFSYNDRAEQLKAPDVSAGDRYLHYRRPQVRHMLGYSPGLSLSCLNREISCPPKSRLVASHRTKNLAPSASQRPTGLVPPLEVGVFGHPLVAASHADLRRRHPSREESEDHSLSCILRARPASQSTNLLADQAYPHNAQEWRRHRETEQHHSTEWIAKLWTRNSVSRTCPASHARATTGKCSIQALRNRGGW